MQSLKITSTRSESINRLFRWRRPGLVGGICTILAICQVVIVAQFVIQDHPAPAPAPIATRHYVSTVANNNSISSRQSASGLENQITMVVLTADEKRFVDLKDIVRIGVNHRLVEEIVIIWNKPSAPEGAARLKLELKEEIDYTNKVRILQSTKNTLNNRYNPNFLQLRTGAVMILDDDLTIIDDTITCAHESWMANKSYVHSFGHGRMVYLDGYTGVAKPNHQHHGPPNFLLPRMIFDAAFLDVYSAPQNADIRDYVDTQEAHCDDIAFASILTKHLDRPLKWIQAPHGSRVNDGKDGGVKWLNPQKHPDPIPRKAPIEGMDSLNNSHKKKDKGSMKETRKGSIKTPKSSAAEMNKVGRRNLSARMDARTECSIYIIRRLNWTMPVVDQSQCSYHSGRHFDMRGKFTDDVKTTKKKKKEKKIDQDGIKALLLPHNISRPFSWETTTLDDQLSNNKTMTSLSNSQRGMISFVHIPKCGGSSIVSLAIQHNMSWGECLFLDKLPKFGMECPPMLNQEQQWSNPFPSQRWWHTPIQYFPPNKTSPYQGFDLFAIIRNPYDRAVSEFFYHCNLKKKKCKDSKDYSAKLMNAHIQKSIQRFRKADKNTTDYYLDYGHWIPQYDFFFDINGKRAVKHLLHLEHLKEQFDSLMRAYYDFDDGDMMVLPDKHVRPRSDFSLGVNDLTASTRKLIESVYQQDFILGGYPMLPNK